MILLQVATSLRTGDAERTNQKMPIKARRPQKITLSNTVTDTGVAGHLMARRKLKMLEEWLHFPPHMLG